MVATLMRLSRSRLSPHEYDVYDFDNYRLQNSDDTKKINELSQFITSLYLSAEQISSVVEDDIKQDGFKYSI